MTDIRREQSPRNAWINMLRAEALRVRTTDIARVVGVGIWIATYADADGSNAYPSRETLGALAGCSTETVTRAVRVLTAVQVLKRTRRPNQSSVYQLLLAAVPLDWDAHMHLLTQTRQREAHAKARAETGKGPGRSRTASTDVIRIASVDCVPDSVQGRGPKDPDSVHGRPRTASTDAFRTASTDAPTTTHLPTVGTPSTDQNRVGLRPQPQVGPPRREHDTQPHPVQSPLVWGLPDARDPTVRSRDRPPMQTCESCDRAFRAADPGLCRDCRVARSDTG